MNWNDAEALLAARNAVVVRAALANSFDPKKAYDGYMETHPDVLKDRTQMRARARAWAMLNVKIEDDLLTAALRKIYATGFVTGDTAAIEELVRAKDIKKDADPKVNLDSWQFVDWNNWKPGDAAAAALLKPPNALANLLQNLGFIRSGIQRTMYEGIGNTLADALAAGFSANKTAKLLRAEVGSPAKALRIAVTEQRRAVSAATMERFTTQGMTQMTWHTVDPCPTCAENSGQTRTIGASFPSGHEAPPAHPYCRCGLLPVVDTSPLDTQYLDSVGIHVVDQASPLHTGTVIQTESAAPQNNENGMPYDLKPKVKAKPFSTYVRKLKEWTWAKNESEQILVDAYRQVASEPLKIQAKSESVEAILSDGRFKSIFEIDPDDWHASARLTVESDYIGVPQVAAKDRPIYGWMHGNATGYGDVTFFLKDSVKERATMTAGDTFYSVNPVPISRVLDRTATTDDLARATVSGNMEELVGRVSRDGKYGSEPWTADNPRYWETQIHGGVTLDDIDHIVIPQDSWDTMSDDAKSVIGRSGIRVELT